MSTEDKATMLIEDEATISTRDKAAIKAEDRATRVSKKRWNRTARRYDRMMAVMNRLLRLKEWREFLWSKVEGTHILEIGVGTGNSFDYYPAGAEITAVDFSEEMLERARNRASGQEVKVHLQQMDVQSLEFEDNTFDTVVASLVFCSIPDQVRGIREVERVCKPGGKVVILEHDFCANRVLCWVVKLTNPLIVRMIGSNFNRRPVDNVTKSDLTIEQVTNIRFRAGIFNFKLIEARKG